MEVQTLKNNIEGEFDYHQEGRIHIFKKWNWDYDQAHQFQKQAHTYIQEHRDQVVLIICNHPTCFTMGRGLQKKKGKILDGLKETESFESFPFPVHKINRGGGLTYHYPGQIIVYPIMQLGGNNPSLSKLADILFESFISTIKEHLEVELTVNRGDLIGLWTSEEINSKKVASFGVGIERFITQHGLALNVNDGEIFRSLASMFPCGIQGGIYSYLAQFKENSELSLEDLTQLFLSKFLKRF